MLHYITSLRNITLQYITSHHITSHYISLHYITLHYITLHYIILYYIILYYIIWLLRLYSCSYLYLRRLSEVVLVLRVPLNASTLTPVRLSQTDAICYVKHMLHSFCVSLSHWYMYIKSSNVVKPLMQHFYSLSVSYSVMQSLGHVPQHVTQMLRSFSHSIHLQHVITSPNNVAQCSTLL